jgi:hypothetical protein
MVGTASATAHARASFVGPFGSATAAYRVHSEKKGDDPADATYRDVSPPLRDLAPAADPPK